MPSDLSLVSQIHVADQDMKIYSHDQDKLFIFPALETCKHTKVVTFMTKQHYSIVFDP